MKTLRQNSRTGPMTAVAPAPSTGEAVASAFAFDEAANSEKPLREMVLGLIGDGSAIAAIASTTSGSSPSGPSSSPVIGA